MILRRRGSRIRSVALLVLVSAASACGEDEAGAPQTNATSGGASGQSGGGAAGSGAGAGTGGSAGKAGGSAGAAGNVGGGAGLGGATTGDKKPGDACKADADCTVAGIETQPPACAETYCKAGTCAARAKDEDGDTFRKKACKLVSDGAFVIELGGDCDDTKKDVNPKGWDGPAADGQPNHCADGVDQDCSGVDGDSVATNGASCTCVPGDVAACAQTASGAPIVFPGGTPAKGSKCQLGSRTCVKDPGGSGGQWGPCANAIGPSIELCNNEDDDCDGATDEADAQGKSTWVYDRDEDDYRATRREPGKPPVAFASLSACKQPNEVPKECDSAYCGSTPIADCCPSDKWRPLTEAGGLDCDDRDDRVHPGAAEECATADRDKDEDCDGENNELPAVGAEIWYYDGDDDGVGDAKTPPKTSCLAPGPNWHTGLVNNDCDDTRAATKPGIPEDCTTPDDDNCSGSTRDGCVCVPSDPQELDCGMPTDCGFIAKGSKCVNGVYELCPEPITPEEYCADVDEDTFCDMATCAPYCKTVSADSISKARPEKFVLRGVCEAKRNDCDDKNDNVSPVRGEVCNGIDDDCDGTVDDDTPGVGTPCDVDGKAAGACRGGGKLACNGTGVPLACRSTHPAIGKPFPAPNPSAALEGWATELAPNGSADWDCNGNVELWVSPQNVVSPYEARPTCGLTPAAICGSAKSYEQCTGPEYAAQHYYADAGGGIEGCSCLPQGCDLSIARNYTCGGALLQFTCGWNGSTCFVLGTVGNLIVDAPGCIGCSPTSTIQRCH